MDERVKDDGGVSKEELRRIESRGYNKDLQPVPLELRSMNLWNYFTLWMGSVHNIPNYASVGAFLLLGLSPIHVMLSLIVSAVAVSAFMVFNGRAGSKYGIPFAMHLRSAYGDTGAKLPGFLRGGVAAIAWFGLQNFTGSQALLILIGKLWPGFLELGGDFSFFGLNLPELLSFTVFWALNVFIGFGGGKLLNRFTAILNPLIYIVFGGMTIWAIRAAGGISPILSYVPSGVNEVSYPTLIAYFIVINSVIAVWAAPGASVADFTKDAKSTRDQALGQMLSLVVGYTLFAVSSVSILIGGSIYYGAQEWNVLTIINKWDSIPAIALATIVLLMTTISTNATGNIIPAAYQLSALFPKKIDYKKGVLLASIISFLIMPWKLMENQDSIFLFLNTIGSILGPVAGVLLAQFYMIQKQRINLDELYLERSNRTKDNPYVGINKNAYIATIVGLVLSLVGAFIPALDIVARLSWIIGAGVAFLLYTILEKNKQKKGE